MSPGERKGPATNGASSKSPGHDDNSILRHELAGYVDHFRARVLQDALTEALRSYWLRRAAAFESAMHRPGKDFPGRRSVDQLAANNRRLAQKAQACRDHASICIFQDRAAICEHLRASA